MSGRCIRLFEPIFKRKLSLLPLVEGDQRGFFKAFFAYIKIAGPYRFLATGLLALPFFSRRLLAPADFRSFSPRPPDTPAGKRESTSNLTHQVPGFPIHNRSPPSSSSIPPPHHNLYNIIILIMIISCIKTKAKRLQNRYSFSRRLGVCDYRRALPNPASANKMRLLHTVQLSQTNR